MKIVKINNSLLLLRINKDSVKANFFYPISLFNWIISSNTIDLKGMTVKLVIQLYKDLQKEYDKKYRV